MHVYRSLAGCARCWFLLAALCAGGSRALAGQLGTPEPGVERAQEPETDGRRPRVGLVLSGGGARGAAHIGIIEVLEDLQVPVDFVVGTSMGAIVGGLYATGYSPEEMSRIIREARWPELLSDAPPRDELWFRRRQDKRRFQVDLEFGWVDGGPALPPGLILGRNVVSFLERLTLPVAGVSDFDRLRLPFRCVATDLADGSSVVFSEGSLSRAIRASMSLPGVFAPVEYDGRILVDGGAVDNIPVDIARELGADIVIVVDISTPLSDVEALSSPLGITNQVVGILMDNNRVSSMSLLNENDIAITPDLGTVTVMAFDRAVEAIDRGREAARLAADEIQALSVGAEEWAAFLERQRMPEQTTPRVRRLTVDSRTRLSERVVRRFSTLHEGEPLTHETLEETRKQLAGLGVFAGVEIDLVPVPGSDDEVDVVLRPIEKAWGPDYLRFGVGVSSDLSGEGDFDLGFQHTSTPLNGYGGEWRNEAQIGSRTRLFTEFYQPLDAGLRWFVAPSVTFEQDNLPLIVNRQTIGEASVEGVGVELAVGRNLGSWGEVRASVGGLSAEVRPAIGDPALLPPSTNVDAWVLSTGLIVDTLDSITFPRHGLLCEIGGTQIDSDDETGTTVEARVGAPWTSRGWTVFAQLEGGATLEGENAIGSDFELGGFRRLSGLGPGEISSNHYGLAVLQPYYQLSERDSLFGMARYVGASLEYGGVWSDLEEVSSDDLLFSGSVYVAFDTLLGSAFLGLGATEGGDRSAYFFLGPLL